MKSILSTVIAGMIVSTTAFAAIPAKVTKAAAQLKSDSVRTRITPVKNPTGPCDSDYMMTIEVRQAGYDQLKGEVVYTWEKVKQAGIDKDGNIMEVCAE